MISIFNKSITIMIISFRNSDSTLLVGRSRLVGQGPIKSLSCVCPFVRPSLSFLKIGSLVFPDIVHDDS